MYRFLSVLAILAANLAAAKVFVLDDSNFEKTLSEHSPMLVEFYAPWCGHCKALEPEYEQAGNILESKKAAVYLGKVDATSEAASQLAKRFEIQGFPTLKFFAKGTPNSEVVDYDGERKATNIVNWLEKKIGPAFTTLTNDADLNKAKASVTADNEKIAVVGVFAEKEQVVAFEQVAKKDFSREYFAVIGNSALASKVASSSAPFIQVLRSFNISNPALTNNAETIGDAAKLEKFILESSEPFSNVVTFTDNDFVGTIAEGVHVVEFYAPWCGYCKQFAPEYEKVALYFKDKEPKVVIAKYDATTNDEVTEREGIESFPTVKIYKNGLSATYNGEMQKDNVVKYIEEKLKAAASTIKDEAAVSSFVTDVPTAVVGCVTAKNDHIIDTIAFQAASAMFKVGKLRCAEGKESISVYLSGKKKSTYPADQSVSDLQAVTKWYKRASVNPVFKFDDVIFDEILAADYKYIVFFLNNNIEGNEPEIKVFEELAAAETFKDTAYAYASAAEDYLLQYFQVKSDDLPVVRLLDTSGGMTSYVGPTDVSKESLATMFQQLEDGSLERVVESEDDGEGDDDEEYNEEDEDEEDEDDDEDNEDEEEEEEEAQDEL